MRSSTASDLPGRCHRCWVLLAHCVCPSLPRVETRTQVLVVRHEREAAKSTGTARIAELALPGLTVVTFGVDPSEADRELAALSLECAALLYPAEPPGPWLHEPPRRLVILDGTWRQTRKMQRKLTALASLPRLTLPPKSVPVLRLREAPSALGRSTLEAIADALRLLEGPAVADPLDALHALYVERVLRARGTWPRRCQDQSLAVGVDSHASPHYPPA